MTNATEDLIPVTLTSEPETQELSDTEIEAVAGGGWWGNFLYAISGGGQEYDAGKTFVAGV